MFIFTCGDLSYKYICNCENDKMDKNVDID